MGSLSSTSTYMSPLAGTQGQNLFYQSNPARKMVFEQLAEALSTGGRGMRTPFMQMALGRSIASGRQAMAGARAGMSGVDNKMRSRAMNRMGRAQAGAQAQLPVNIASQMIGAAPAAAMGALRPEATGMSIGIAGRTAATEATLARTRSSLVGVGGLTQSLGKQAGQAYSDYSAGLDPYADSTGVGGNLNEDVIDARATEYDRIARARTGMGEASSNNGWWDRIVGAFKGEGA